MPAPEPDSDPPGPPPPHSQLRKAGWLVTGFRQSEERVLASGADGLPGHTCAVDAVEAVLVAELRLELVSRVRPLSEQGWLVQRAAPNELVVLDPELTPIWRLELPAGRLGFVAVTDDLSLVAVSRDGQVVLLDGTGRQLASVAGAHPQSSIGVFTADGAYLWAVSPGQGSEAPVTASQELWLIEVAGCSMVDRRRIGCWWTTVSRSGIPIGTRSDCRCGSRVAQRSAGQPASVAASTFALPRGAIASSPTCILPGRST